MSNGPFDALTIVSPLAEGGDEKNQDRARWFPQIAVATVCDGVSSSPHSAEAAELVADLSPMLFSGNTDACLNGICHLLVTRRLASQNSPIATAATRAPALQAQLEEIARKRLARAFQTTLITASFTPVDDCVNADVVRCGDSALFAFAPSGEVLFASPPVGQGWGRVRSTVGTFGPGDVLLVRLLGPLDQHPALAAHTDILKTHRAVWHVCLPLDRCPSESGGQRARCDATPIPLDPQTLLLVPGYHVGRARDDQGAPYYRLHFSANIRPIRTGNALGEPGVFESRSSATAVLPEHGKIGWFRCRETVPLDTQFVLASDGLYGAFDAPGELWQWLFSHRKTLEDPQSRLPVLRGLHAQLSMRGGDDDISFVWVSRREAVSGGRRDATPGTKCEDDNDE